MPTNFNSFFENVTDRISGFLKKSDSVIGVDIGSSAIKVVQLQAKQGKAVLETYGELALGPYSNLSIGQATSLPIERVIEALKDVMREANVSARSAGFAIPLASSLVTIIEMPYISDRQFKEMVPLEARKYIPVPISEVKLDWKVLPRLSPGEAPQAAPQEGFVPRSEEKTRKEKVLLAAIHNEVLSKYEHIAEKTGLNVGFFEIEVFSSIRSLLRRDAGTVFVLDIGAGTTKILMVEDGIIMSSHIINRGSQDITLALSKSQGVSITKAEEMKRTLGLSDDPAYKNERELMILVINSILVDANRAIADYERKFHKPVKKVVLSGGGSLLKGLEAEAQKNFEMQVERAHPFSKVETPAFLEPTLRDAGPNFAVALGIALRKLQEAEY